jgi:hypothetical protein
MSSTVQSALTKVSRRGLEFAVAAALSLGTLGAPGVSAASPPGSGPGNPQAVGVPPCTPTIAYWGGAGSVGIFGEGHCFTPGGQVMVGVWVGSSPYPNGFPLVWAYLTASPAVNLPPCVRWIGNQCAIAPVNTPGGDLAIKLPLDATQYNWLFGPSAPNLCPLTLAARDLTTNAVAVSPAAC